MDIRASSMGTQRGSSAAAATNFLISSGSSQMGSFFLRSLRPMASLSGMDTPLDSSTVLIRPREFLTVLQPFFCALEE